MLAEAAEKLALPAFDPFEGQRILRWRWLSFCRDRHSFYPKSCCR